MAPTREYVPLAEVAKKWRHTEDELIQWAMQKTHFKLYYFKRSPLGLCHWLIIGNELGCFLSGEDSVSCKVLIPTNPINSLVPFVGTKCQPADLIPFILDTPVDLDELLDLSWFPEQIVTVNRSDLHLHRDQIAKMEEIYPDLAGKPAKIETYSKLEESNSAKPSDTSNGKSNIDINGKPVVHLQSEDDSEVVSPSTLTREEVATIDNIPALPDDIANMSHSIAQSKKQNSAKLSKKKKEKTDKLDINRTVETPLAWKGDREPLPLKTLADLQTRTLRLDDIIGNPKKGIPAIIRVSKSTWYAGVKSGLYPPSFELSPGCVAWRGADIYAFLKKKGLV